MKPLTRERLEWLFNHPSELIKVFDDLTDSEMQILIETRDRRRDAESKAKRLQGEGQTQQRTQEERGETPDEA